MTPPIRLIIQQPSLAKYRVPVFRELAKCPDIDLKLLYGARPDLPNVEADGFKAEPVYLWQQKIRGQQVFWHSAQWNSASRKQADVLILTWNPRYTSLVPTLLKAKAMGVRTILWGHGYSKTESTVRKKIRYSVAKLATSLMFYNQRAEQSYLDAGWDPQSIFVARNSLDQAPIQTAKVAWQQSSEKLEQFRREQNLGPGPHILFVSRLDPDNRLDLLVEAVAKLSAEFPHLQVNIVGKGAAEQERLQVLAGERGVGAHFRFVGPIYEELALAPWFLTANVFCYPANIGLSVLHAFGYGLPVVTSDDLSGQNPEIEALKPGENGLFYRHEDAGALADCLRSIILNPDVAQRMSAEAVRTVTEEFSLPHMVGQMAAAVRYCAAKT
ncbi:MAG: glycosyltransferase family 4 protein [Bythopirellula sp.]|nr:glycosyltransferase family 4 protein [Bythopirellula sp.]